MIKKLINQILKLKKHTYYLNLKCETIIEDNKVKIKKKIKQDFQQFPLKILNQILKKLIQFRGKIKKFNSTT